MDKTFSLQVNVINGEFKEFPETFHFKCYEVVPVGETTIRYFDEDMCSVAMKTFYVRKGENLFGTTQFKTLDEFYQYQKNVCDPTEYGMYLGDCQLLLYGEKLSI